MVNDFRCYSILPYLEHHGILGQRWGDRNGPPYPLDQPDHSRREHTLANKAGVKVGKDSGYGSTTNLNSKKRARSKFVYSKSDYSKQSEETKKANQEKIKKALLIAGGVAVTAGVAYGIYKYKTSGGDGTVIDAGNDAIKNVLGEASESTLDKVSDAVKEQAQSSAPSLTDFQKTCLDKLSNDGQSAALNSFTSNLTDSEFNAVTAYSHNCYTPMNLLMRGLKDPSEITNADLYEQINKTLKSGLDKCKLAKDATVYRGIDSDAMDKYFGEDVTDLVNQLKNSGAIAESGGHIKNQGLEGLSYLEKGFMSTSMASKAAKSFADEGCVLDIHAGAGLHGMSIKGLSNFPTEDEVVFQAGSRIALTGDISIIDGVLHLGCELIQNA